MQQFTRTIGLLTMISGVLLLVFPGTSRQLIEVRGEFAQLSHGALRLLGGWFLLTGVLLVSATTTPAMEVRTGEFVSPELRKAA